MGFDLCRSEASAVMPERLATINILSKCLNHKTVQRPYSGLIWASEQIVSDQFTFGKKRKINVKCPGSGFYISMSTHI